MPATASTKRFSVNPLMWLASAFAAGIIAAHSLGISITTFLVFIAAAAIGTFALWQRNSAAHLVVLAFVALGGFCYQIERAGIAENRLTRIYDDGRAISGEPVEIEGVVLGRPEPAFDGFFITLDSRRAIFKGIDQEVSGKLRLFAPIQTAEAKTEFDNLDLRHGTRIRVACRPEREDRFLNPGVVLRKQLLDQQGIDATATLKSPLLVERLGRERTFLPLAFIYEQRQKLITEIRERFSARTSGVLIASMLGDKYFLDKQTADVFREGGTFHVLVISGLHITFIGGLVLFLVRFFTKNRKLQAVLAVSALWLYGIAVGGEAPVIRACVMFTILLLSYVIYRKATLVNALGVCALVLLVWKPSELFNPSFQLTFVSVAAIVAMGFPLIEKIRAIGSWSPSVETPFPPNVLSRLKRFCEMLYWRPESWEIEHGRQIWSAQIFKSPYLKKLGAFGIRRTLVFVFEGIVVSLAVQIWLLPLLVIYFHRVSIASIILNLWVGVMLAIESFAALAGVFLGRVSDLLAFPFVRLAEFLNWLLVSIPSMFIENGWVSVRVPIYPGPMLAIYCVYFIPVIAAAFVVYFWDPFSLKKKVMWKRPIIFAAPLSIIFLGGIIAFHPASEPAPDGRLRVDFLDVGQGDAALITFPNGETMLVDGGGRLNYRREADGETEPFEPDAPRIGEAVVSEFLWERGYSRVDHIVATHADADHIQGLSDIAKNFNVGSAYFGRIGHDDPDLSKLLAVLNKHKVPVIEVGTGDVFEIAGVRIEVLNPDRNLIRNPSSSNNESIVLRLVFGETSILLTGDIERDTEAALIASGADLSSTVLKVPHHGSRSSSTSGFLDAVAAKYAVVSVGRRSVFGHPHAEVVVDGNYQDQK